MANSDLKGSCSSKSLSPLSSAKRLSGKFASKRSADVFREQVSPFLFVKGWLVELYTSALDIVYVIKHHETLKHVLVFITLAGTSHGNSITLMGMLTTEVLPSMVSGGDWLLPCHSGTPSPLLTLPVAIVLGVKDVTGCNSHWEIKLSCAQPSQQPFGSANGSQTNIVAKSDGKILALVLVSILLILYALYCTHDSWTHCGHCTSFICLSVQ